jgi:hypothetical protein
MTKFNWEKIRRHGSSIGDPPDDRPSYPCIGELVGGERRPR